VIVLVTAILVLVGSIADHVGSAASTVVVVGAALTFLVQGWRKVVRPLVRGAEAVVEVLRTTDRRLSRSRRRSSTWRRSWSSPVTRTSPTSGRCSAAARCRTR
jgi:hypothetical protein